MSRPRFVARGFLVLVGVLAATAVAAQGPLRRTVGMPAFEYPADAFAPVVDQTGLIGPFNYSLQFNRGETADSPYPSLFAALDEQLGLKLESARGPVEFLVIDSVGPLIPD